jgi:two-component system sensor histidine kinase KdpD
MTSVLSPDPRSRHTHTARSWIVWLFVLAAVSTAMLMIRGRLNEAHVALFYLLVVQVGSAREGRSLGLFLAALAFLCFDWFFLPPYGTFLVAKSLDWAVLGVFLITSVVAAQLFERVRAEAEAARARTEEIDRLSSLGSETLNAARAEEALAAIAGVIRSALELDSCEVYASGDDHEVPRLISRIPEDEPTRSRSQSAEIMGQVVRSSSPVAIRSSGIVDEITLDASPSSKRLGIGNDTRELMIPLTIRERVVGVLVAARAGGLTPQPSQLRFLGALSYYAALGVERVRLAARAEHADALREASRLKDAVLASVSHDLRTPLTTIKALAADIAAGGDDRAITIEEEADRLNSLVANLLDISRLNSGTASLNPEPNEAEDLIGAALQRVTGAANGREIRVSLDEGEPLLVGRFDFPQTLRALVNLLENALKYSPPSEPIDIAVRREGEWLAFSVSDKGSGVPSTERERIFEPFYRRPELPPDVGGAGLGLSIARALAEAQGASLRYEPRENGGSVFTLRVPAIDLKELAES